MQIFLKNPGTISDSGVLGTYKSASIRSVPKVCFGLVSLTIEPCPLGGVFV
jgi:hypothetical protein